MESFDFEIFFRGLYNLDELYHLTSSCTSQSKLRNIVSNDIMNGLDYSRDIEFLASDILQCVAPSLDYFVQRTQIDYPYDLDLEIISLLIKSGYPNGK